MPAQEIAGAAAAYKVAGVVLLFDRGISGKIAGQEIRSLRQALPPTMPLMVSGRAVDLLAKPIPDVRTAVDFSSVMAKALPLFLTVVVGLGFLMLLILFRAPVVSLTAVVTSLLSFVASLGVTVAVFQWGWLNDILGVTGTGPTFPFLPVMVFAILFRLSMDYQVFLVSRMHEEWGHTHDNALSVRRGLAGSGRVVAIAAAIMASVFIAFIPVSYTHLRAHETVLDLVCRLLLEKKKDKKKQKSQQRQNTM